VPILISIAGACLIGLLIYGISTQSASRTLDTEVHDGRHPAAPDASTVLPVLGGHGTGSLASQRGKVVLLNFWASWCQPCEREAPLLERAEAALRRYRGTVLGVTYKDATPDSEHFVRQFHLTYPSLRDGSGSFAAAYGTDQLPESFIVDRDGHVVKLYRGEIGNEFIEKAIALARASS
jgi:cytochrome c biogenesis protein CcmG/thiol:disulfide interchange protein DsbE